MADTVGTVPANVADSIEVLSTTNADVEKQAGEGNSGEVDSDNDADGENDNEKKGDLHDESVQKNILDVIVVSAKNKADAQAEWDEYAAIEEQKEEEEALAAAEKNIEPEESVEQEGNVEVGGKASDASSLVSTEEQGLVEKTAPPGDSSYRALIDVLEVKGVEEVDDDDNYYKVVSGTLQVVQVPAPPAKVAKSAGSHKESKAVLSKSVTAQQMYNAKKKHIMDGGANAAVAGAFFFSENYVGNDWDLKLQKMNATVIQERCGVEQVFFESEADKKERARKGSVINPSGYLACITDDTARTLYQTGC